MTRILSRTLVLAASLLVALAVVGLFDAPGENAARAEVRRSVPGDLFYNYYVPGTVTAAMYPCPRPTPPLVGHTYVTYQPLMPHEFLYPHRRVYWHQHPGAGWTRTKVQWR
jgi:hypothetical protein